MSVRFARGLSLVFIVAFALAVTWPGYLPFNRIHPLVLGLPFSLVWLAGWITAGCLVLWILDTAERRGGRR